MRQSLKTLLAESLDYAGMFPPATLSLEEAFRRYLEYQDCGNAWMLVRFVCPSWQLSELESQLQRSPTRNTIRLSVIGTPDVMRTDLLATFAGELRMMAEFRERIGERAVIEFYERSLPEGLIEDNVEARQFARAVVQHVRAAGFDALQIFFELPAFVKGMPWLRRVPPGAQAAWEEGLRFGIKIRAGGSRSVDFPPPEALAGVIAACGAAGCPWKATAGLHEPLSRVDSTVDSKMKVWRFGFLNLFAASVLAKSHELPPERIEPILQESDGSAFKFAENSFAWRDLSATCDQIAAARRQSLISFGSCSFDEPLAGLQRMNLL
jgi:hypothetical protein